MGRRGGHRRQPGLHRHRRRLLQGLRCRERRGALELPGGHRDHLPAHHLGDGRRAVHRRDHRLRWRGAAVGWRHGRADPDGGTGGLLLGLQAAGLRPRPGRQLSQTTPPAATGRPALFRRSVTCPIPLPCGVISAASPWGRCCSAPPWQRRRTPPTRRPFTTAACWRRTPSVPAPTLPAPTSPTWSCTAPTSPAPTSPAPTCATPTCAASTWRGPTCAAPTSIAPE